MVIWKGQFASFEGLSCADKHCRGFVIKYVKVSSHSKNQPRTWNTLVSKLRSVYCSVNQLLLAKVVFCCSVLLFFLRKHFKAILLFSFQSYFHFDNNIHSIKTKITEEACVCLIHVMNSLFQRVIY